MIKTKRSDLHLIIEFLEIVGRLKRTLRSGWIEVGISQPESVADHTFRTTIICMIFADMKGLDQLKLLKMALIHDLPEAIIGDVTPSQKTKEIIEKEKAAINRILDLLPRKQREEYVMIWKEYQQGKTEEAKAMRQLDKIEMAIQAKEYEKTKSKKTGFKRFNESTIKAITWPELRELLEYIQERR